jgi:hypothetical protein
MTKRLARVVTEEVLELSSAFHRYVIENGEVQSRFRYNPDPVPETGSLLERLHADGECLRDANIILLAVKAALSEPSGCLDTLHPTVGTLCPPPRFHA